MVLSYENLEKLFPRARKELLEVLARQFPELAKKYDLTTKQRINYLFAQIGHESNGYTVFEENLRYSAKRLMEVWPKRFPNLSIANQYANNPMKLANKVYANRMGNGDEASGDGWKYRGRGPIQITGKSNYQAISKIIGQDFVNNPDLILDPNYLFESACAFWKMNNLNLICDSGNFILLTQKINGGTVGLEDRRNWLKRVENILG